MRAGKFWILIILLILSKNLHQNGMVPFSFHQGLLKSRVMKEYLTGALDDGINGFWDHWVQRHTGGAWSLESGAFALSCLLDFLMVIPARAKICSNWACPEKVDRPGNV